MVNPKQSTTSGRRAIVQWTARIGAVTAEALAEHLDTTLPSARARLLAAERAQLITHRRPLAEGPALYTATPAGLRVCKVQGLDPCRVSASNARHLIACASVAAALELCYPNQRVLGERELRRDERARGVERASARLARLSRFEPRVARSAPQ
jgi:hypothetical protein